MTKTLQCPILNAVAQVNRLSVQAEREVQLSTGATNGISGISPKENFRERRNSGVDS
jgi:hypothetical protein